MTVMNGKEVHPLRQKSIRLGGRTYFELNTAHNRSWFILDLALPGSLFVPAGSAEMRTQDGKTLGTKTRRR